MLDMEMGQQAYGLQARFGRACTRTPRRRSSWSGTGGSRSEIEPPGGKPFDVVLVDQAPTDERCALSSCRCCSPPLAVVAPAARADGDPASDYLITRQMFLPFNAKIPESRSRH